MHCFCSKMTWRIHVQALQSYKTMVKMQPGFLVWERTSSVLLLLCRPVMSQTLRAIIEDLSFTGQTGLAIMDLQHCFTVLIHWLWVSGLRFKILICSASQTGTQSRGGDWGMFWQFLTYPILSMPVLCSFLYHAVSHMNQCLGILETDNIHGKLG